MLQDSASNNSQLTDLYKLNDYSSDNEGANLFKVDYKPSIQSEKAQKALEEEI